jgi:hypothetical protein
MALTRGLLLDLLVTGDRAGVDAAMERFISRYLEPPIDGGQPSPNTTVTVTPTS